LGQSKPFVGWNCPHVLSKDTNASVPFGANEGIFDDGKSRAAIAT
jgi:hypothetical protein